MNVPPLKTSGPEHHGRFDRVASQSGCGVDHAGLSCHPSWGALYMTAPDLRCLLRRCECSSDLHCTVSSLTMSQSQISTGQNQGGSIDRGKHGLCLLSLGKAHLVRMTPSSRSAGNANKSHSDGGGVRGLSSLYILQRLMRLINAEREAESLPRLKPCEVFDLIGGTSTGGFVSHNRLFDHRRLTLASKSDRHNARSAGVGR